jgi:hypothetical protein
MNCHCKGELRVSSNGKILLEPKLLKVFKKYEDKTIVTEQLVDL